MKLRIIVFLISAGICMLLAIGVSREIDRRKNIEKAYFAAGGDFVVKDKFRAGCSYFLYIEYGGFYPYDHATLSCTRAQYQQVEIGDHVYGEWYHNVQLSRGRVHRIRPFVTSTGG